MIYIDTNNSIPQISKHFVIEVVMGLNRYVNIETHFNIESDGFKVSVQILKHFVIKEVMGL